MVTVSPHDSFRAQVYIASLGPWLTLDAGKFESIEVNPDSGAVRVGLAGATEATPKGLLRIEQPARVSGVGNYRPALPLQSQRGAYVVPLQKETTWLELNAGR